MKLTGFVESPVQGVILTTVLSVSTRHMPDYDIDLSEFSWGHAAWSGTDFIYAHDDTFAGRSDGYPDWLSKICIITRDKYNANWVLLDPDGFVFEDDFPIFHS